METKAMLMTLVGIAVVLILVTFAIYFSGGFGNRIIDITQDMLPGFVDVAGGRGVFRFLQCCFGRHPSRKGVTTPLMVVIFVILALLFVAFVYPFLSGMMYRSADAGCEGGRDLLSEFYYSFGFNKEPKCW